jgi:hypothetical protein
LNLPVQQLHAGEELLWVVIPAFAIMMIVDIVKRRRIRKEQEPESDPGDRADDSPGGR